MLHLNWYAVCDLVIFKKRISHFAKGYELCIVGEQFEIPEKATAITPRLPCCAQVSRRGIAPEPLKLYVSARINFAADT